MTEAEELLLDWMYSFLMLEEQDRLKGWHLWVSPYFSSHAFSDEIDTFLITFLILYIQVCLDKILANISLFDSKSRRGENSDTQNYSQVQFVDIIRFLASFQVILLSK